MRARLLGLLVKNLGLTFDIVHRGTSTSAQGVFVGAHVSMSRAQDTIGRQSLPLLVQVLVIQ